MANFSKHQDGTHFIHGHKITDLAERLSFTQGIFYTWTGRMPDEKQEAMLNACLVALIDHGEDALSAKAARIAASGGADTHAAVAAGMLAAGKHHGASVLQLATELYREAVEHGRTAKDIVADALANGQRLPGYGHRVYETDPRTTLLLAKAEKFGFMDAHVRLAVEIEQELERQKGKKLCLNVDGAIASLLPGLGIPSNLAPGLFLVSRAVGLTMHVAEEGNEKPASQRKA
jgi:citrate synthase